MSSICDICANKCFGIDGYDGSCCTIEGRDYIIGPINETEEFLNRLNQKTGRNFLRKQIFIDYEEGKDLFPDKPTWQNPKNFPAMRIDFSKSKLPCIFYNTHAKFCSVHDIRPKACQDYFCEYLMGEIGVKANIKEDTEVPNNSTDPFIT